MNDKLIGVFKIDSSNTDGPYVHKTRGCRVRRGSNNSYPTRRDFDNLYSTQEKVELELMENNLGAVYLYLKLNTTTYKFLQK